MALASALTCVDYFASTNYNCFDRADLRYSPTFNVDDFLSRFVKQQHCSGESQGYAFSSAIPPVLDFKNLSIGENNNNNTESQDFVAKYEKFQEKKQYNLRENDEQQANFNKKLFVDTIGCCQRESQILSPKPIFRSNSCADNINASDDEDEELESIFSKSKPFNKYKHADTEVLRKKSSSFPGFSERLEDNDFSDSESELSQINFQDFAKSNRRKRTCDDFHNNDPCWKRPCIDAEKMHRSLNRGDHYKFYENELFVPIEIREQRNFLSR